MQIEKETNLVPSFPTPGAAGSDIGDEGRNKGDPPEAVSKGGETQDENGVDMAVDAPSPLGVMETTC